MNKLRVIKKNKKKTHDYAIFHISKHHKINALKTNKIDLS